MLITKFIEIDMGHRVTNHKSRCANFHGHRYRIVVGVDDRVVVTPGTSDEGMVIDFSDVKAIMVEEIDAKYDHGFVLWEGDEFATFFADRQKAGMRVILVPFIPTAENLAKHWFTLLAKRLIERDIAIKFVEVYETPTSTARYTAENWLEDNK